MSYYNVLGLDKEPFSTSPDPGFMYRSETHMRALCRLEVAVRLRRGLSLLLGDVGTGKTTLARALIQVFGNEPDFVFHIMLDPHYSSRRDFISGLCRIFGLSGGSIYEPDEIERYLFRKGVTERKVIVLIVDEGQKLNTECIEVLRTLLNYETNEFKLLQLVIMGQLEFLGTAGKIRNFMDRVAFKYLLNPLDRQETKKMLEYRLRRAGGGVPGLFTDEAVTEIYNYTKGYPRRITSLCHSALESAVMYGKEIIGVEMIRDIIKQEVQILQTVHLASLPPVRAAGI